MGTSYDLKEESWYIERQTNMNMLEAGFTCTLMFVQSVEDFNPDSPDSSFLDNDISISSFSEDSIREIQKLVNRFESKIDDLEEKYEHEYSQEELGYYLYMILTGQGVCITDSDSSDFAQQFRKTFENEYIECYSYIEDSEDDYVVHVEFSG